MRKQLMCGDVCANMPFMDELDRRITAALQVNGRASWQQVAGVVGTSESTVSRRAQRLFGSGKVKVVAIADPVRCGLGYWVLLQVKCELGKVPRVARALAARSDVRYLALVTGQFDILVEMIVPSRRDLGMVVVEELPEVEGIEQISTRTVLRNFKMSYDWSRGLLGGAAGSLERFGIPPGTAGAPRKLDELDLRLYGLLLEDGRRSYSELASTAGVGEPLAKRRVEALWEEGCIRFATLVDPALLGYGVEFVCWVRVDLSRLEQAAQTLAALPEVRYISATIDYSDLICEVVLRSEEDLYGFCTEILGELPGMREVNVNLKLKTVKQAYVHLGPPGGGSVLGYETA